MVVLDQFYQISPAETSKVSIFWKVAHVFVFIGAAASGFLTAFCFGKLLDVFNYNCVLNAEIVFDNETLLVNSTNRSVHAIDLTRTFWGARSECYFTQFTPLFTMISAVIWGSFFTVIGRGGGGYATDLFARPWAIIYPCIFFTVVTIITHLASEVRLENGLAAFCSEFSSQFNSSGCVEGMDIFAKQFHVDKEWSPYANFYMNQAVAVICAKIGFWFWIIQLGLLIVRVLLVVDFDLHLITILSKEEERVENVIEPEMVDDESPLV